MSSLYQKISMDVSPLKMYGFQKVSPAELQGITDRLLKPTYNIQFYNAERFQMQPSPPRVPSKRCPKAPRTGKEAGPKEFRMKVPAPQPMVDRIVKRLSATTISRMAAEGTIGPSYEDNIFQNQRPKTAPAIREGDRDSSGMRKIPKYRRPTTASKYRTFCGFCEDPSLQRYLDLDFSEDKVVDTEELQDILQRLQTPTQASTLASRQGSAKRCRKRSEVQAPPKNLPLVSGLEKTKSKDDIYERLYSTPTFAIATKSRHSNQSYNEKMERKKRLEATPTCIVTK